VASTKNCQEGIYKDNMAKSKIGEIREENKERTLGLKWKSSSHTWTYRFESTEITTTKRMAFSQIDRFFDPLGFLNPIFFKKIQLMSFITKSKKVNWDEE
jgi:Pao retrotransposon peptidase